MIRFAELYNSLDSTTKTNEKISAMADYFSAAPPADAAWATYFLAGNKLRRLVPTKLLRIWAAEEAGIAAWLFDESYHAVGDLAETLSLSRIKDNVAYVRRATGQPDSVPRWMGGRMPLSSELSTALRKKLGEAAQGRLVGREMKALQPLFAIQRRWSVLPHDGQLLMERIKTRGGYQLFVFPFEGRLVHEGLAALLAYRISRTVRTTFTMACNDYGLVLQSPHQIEIESMLDEGLWSTDQLLPDILSSMNSTEMAKRQFRQIARVAGLIHPGYPGQRKSTSHVQASSNLFFDVFCQYDPDNLLLEQARREVLEQQLESSRLITALDRLQNCEMVVTEPPKVTPLAFPLLVDKLRERVSSETLAERIRRMQDQLEKAADG